jgi:hypothetical protein
MGVRTGAPHGSLDGTDVSIAELRARLAELEAESDTRG